MGKRNHIDTYPGMIRIALFTLGGLCMYNGILMAFYKWLLTSTDIIEICIKEIMNLSVKLYKLLTHYLCEKNLYSKLMRLYTHFCVSIISILLTPDIDFYTMMLKKSKKKEKSHEIQKDFSKKSLDTGVHEEVDWAPSHILYKVEIIEAPCGTRKT